METICGNRTAPAAPADPAQRGRPRDSLLLSAQLAVAGEPPVTVRVRNLSAGGLMAEHADSVLPGTPVTVTVRGLGELTGRIAWAVEGRIGIAFDRSVDPKRARKPVGSRSTARPGY